MNTERVWRPWQAHDVASRSRRRRTSAWRNDNYNVEDAKQQTPHQTDDCVSKTNSLDALGFVKVTASQFQLSESAKRTNPGEAMARLGHRYGSVVANQSTARQQRTKPTKDECDPKRTANSETNPTLTKKAARRSH